MKKVLFLGAGFSAPFGLPVMNNFFQTAADSQMLQPSEKLFLENLLQFAYKSTAFISIQRNNFEDVLSFLIMAEQLGIQPPAIREAVKGLRHSNAESLLSDVVRRVYGPLEPRTLAEKAGSFGTLMEFDRDDRAENELTIITTNYDMIVEATMLLLQRRVRIPGEYISTSGRPLETENSYSVYDINSKISLCKLHGSVNWKNSNASGDENKFIVENRLQNYSLPGTQRLIHLPIASFREFHGAEYVPLIVTPSLFKHQTDKRFDAIWSTAASAIRAADRLLFVGFSFPESDTYMRYFLGAALVENVKLTGIGVLDPRAKEICERLRSDQRYGRHFHDLLRPIPERWEGQRPWGQLA